MLVTLCWFSSPPSCGCAEDAAADLIGSVREARRHEQNGDTAAAAEAYLSCVRGFKDASIPPAKQALVRLMAAPCLTKQSRWDDAIECLKPLVREELPLTPPQSEQAEKETLRLGRAALTAGALSSARAAFGSIAEKPDSPRRATGALGLAWTVLVDPEASFQAIGIAMQSFVRDFPTHADAPVACEQAVRHFIRAEQIDRADEVFGTLVAGGRPQSRAEKTLAIAAELAEAMGRTCLSDPSTGDDWNDTDLVRWLRGFVSDEETVATDDDSSEVAFAPTASQAYLLLSATAASGSPAEFDEAVGRLGVSDASGRWTRVGLRHFADQDDAVLADTMATRIVGELGNPAYTTAAKAAAAMFLSQAGKWSTLATAAGTVSPSDIHAEPAPTAEAIRLHRILAEALTQTSDVQAALNWWQDLVDTRGDAQFATLLRLAETASIHCELPEASRRLSAAARAGGDRPDRQAYLTLLEADLGVRGLRFDHARGLLETVVRGSDVVTELRGRAQWMIGETYYLQQNFQAAITAYRQVEGIDPDSPWVAASLVQAGKSFEQLGRTQAAGVCYGTLIQRFADSPHADAARRRLASLPAGNSSDDSTLKR